MERSLNRKSKLDMQVISLFIKLIVSTGLLCFLSACKQEVQQREFEFDYYPERNIYYNVATSTFIYSLDGAKTWDSLRTDTKADLETLGKHEKIFSKAPEVWKDNKTHLEMYEGKIYNIITEEDKKYVASPDEVTDKRSVESRAGSTNPSNKTMSDPPKKKGLKGFFDRVFKKKEKK